MVQTVVVRHGNSAEWQTSSLNSQQTSTDILCRALQPSNTYCLALPQVCCTISRGHQILCSAAKLRIVTPCVDTTYGKNEK